MQLLVKQSRPNAPMATRNLYLQARPVEVYPVIYALLPGYGFPERHHMLLHAACHRSLRLCIPSDLPVPVEQSVRVPLRGLSVEAFCWRRPKVCEAWSRACVSSIRGHTQNFCMLSLTSELLHAERAWVRRWGTWPSSPSAPTQGRMQLPPCTACMRKEPPPMSSTYAATPEALSLPVRRLPGESATCK